jgi:hypothetical protein
MERVTYLCMLMAMRRLDSMISNHNTSDDMSGIWDI